MGASERTLDLMVMPARYSICRLDPRADVPSWAVGGAFSSVTRTPTELSVVCETEAVPSGIQVENGWRAFAVQGPLDFGLVGVVAGLAGPLATAGISIFAISTYDTDYLLVRDRDLARAADVLRASGHRVSDPSTRGLRSLRASDERTEY